MQPGTADTTSTAQPSTSSTPLPEAASSHLLDRGRGKEHDKDPAPAVSAACRRHSHVWIPWIIALVVVSVLEIGFFNLGYWRTRALPQVHQGTAQIGEGLEALGDGNYRVTDPAKATITVPVSQDDGRPVEVGSVRVMPGEPADPSTFPKQTVAFAVKPVEGESSGVDTKDFAPEDKIEDAEDLKIAPDGTVYPKDEWIDARDSDGWWADTRNTLTYGPSQTSQYLLFGAKPKQFHATEARIAFLEDKGATVSFDRMEVNATVPFALKPLRIGLELAFALLFVLFRPSSYLYRVRMRTASRNGLQIAATVVFIAGWSLMLAILAKRTQEIAFGPMPTFPQWLDTEQYQRLGDAIIHGRAWLDLPVDSSLTTMDNPYSNIDRGLLATHGDHVFFWDHAYANGHYYCYFGVVPAVLMFVPFQLITGAWLPTWVAIALCCTIATAFGTLLVQRLARDYFPNASLGMVWLATIALNLGLNLFQYVHKSDFYGIPMTAAIAFALAGLWFWQIAKREDGTVNGWLIAAGSLVLALELGTRPQFLVVWVLAFAIFWKQITHYRTLFSRSSIGVTIAALAPFVVVALPLLWYNHIRFGSFLDFGQNYNLTVYDLTSRQGSPYILPIELFNQLFQPVNTSGTFPFLTTVDTTVAAPNESSIGGYFAIVPVACLALLFLLVRRRLAARGLLGLTSLAMGLGAVALLFDTLKSGTTMRYYGDFAYLVMLCAVLTLFAFESLCQHDDGMPLDQVDYTRTAGSVGFRTLVTITVTLAALTALITFFGMFVNGRYNEWSYVLPGLYADVKSWFLGLTS